MKYSATTNNAGVETSAGQKMLYCYFSDTKGNRKSLSGNDNTLVAEVLSSFFKSMGKLSDKMATNILEIQEELWRLGQILLLQLDLETFKQFYQH